MQPGTSQWHGTDCVRHRAILVQHSRSNQQNRSVHQRRSHPFVMAHVRGYDPAKATRQRKQISQRETQDRVPITSPPPQPQDTRPSHRSPASPVTTTRKRDTPRPCVSLVGENNNTKLARDEGFYNIE